jgi:hypothetical protein
LYGRISPENEDTQNYGGSNPDRREKISPERYSRSAHMPSGGFHGIESAFTVMLQNEAHYPV